MTKEILGRLVSLLMLAAFAVSLVLPLAGCDRRETLDTSLATAPALPDEFQGAWRFDRAATLAAWQSVMPDDLYQQEMQFVGMMDKLGHPLHSDLRVDGAALVGVDGGGGVEPQYDLTQWSREGEGIIGVGWWHEDRHHPGERTSQTFILQLREGVLWLGFGDGGPRTLWFLFARGG